MTSRRWIAPGIEKAITVGTSQRWQTPEIIRGVSDGDGRKWMEPAVRAEISENVSQGGGGGGSYSAKAVHFDGDTWLEHESLVATDNHFFSFVGWFRASNVSSSPALFVTDPNTNYSPWLELTVDINGDGVSESAVCDASGNNYEYERSDSNSFPNDTWNCIIGCYDTSTAFGVGKVYSRDVDVTGTANGLGPGGGKFPSDHGGSVPFNIASNGKSWYFASDSFGNNLIGDAADWRIMPGTNLLVDGDIPLATRRLFIDANGKPVDPAVATAALGRPVLLFSGDHTTFPLNQGTGGEFMLTGTLTNASTSPSD